MSLHCIIFLILFKFAESDDFHIVCNDCEDYTKKTENCEYNYDVLSDVVSIIKRHGYEHETHYVTSEDGITTPIYRLLPRAEDNGHNTPIFMQHGLEMDATMWVVSGNRSLAFLLSNKGYDVWLGNFRNSHHSVQVNYDPNRSFFNFSFHELGNYDIRAQLDYVAEQTDRRGDIIFLGHSMGTTAGFIYVVDRTEDAERNLRAFVAVAPVAYLHHCPHFFDGKYLTYYMVNYGPNLLETYGYGAFLNTTNVANSMVSFCTMNAYTCGICFNLIQFVAGYNPEQFSAKYVPILMSYGVYANPIKALLHYIIMSHYNNFTRYDYQSTKDNFGIYDLKKIKLPVSLFYGSNDKFSNEPDVLLLYNVLETEKEIFKVAGNNGTNDFNHIDFIFAKDIEPFHTRLFKVIEKFTNCDSISNNV